MYMVGIGNSWNLYSSENDKKIQTKMIDKSQLKHLKFQSTRSEYIVSLVDLQGEEILKGYGKTMEEAINDLHSNLI